MAVWVSTLSGIAALAAFASTFLRFIRALYCLRILILNRFCLLLLLLLDIEPPCLGKKRGCCLAASIAATFSYPIVVYPTDGIE